MYILVYTIVHGWIKGAAWGHMLYKNRDKEVYMANILPETVVHIISTILCGQIT